MDSNRRKNFPYVGKAATADVALREYARPFRPHPALTRHLPPRGKALGEYNLLCTTPVCATSDPALY